MPDSTGPALPRGPHKLSRDEVAASQRGRLLAALVEVAAETGIGATKVSTVCRRAGVSNSAFYAHFSGKDDAFLVAYDAFAQQVADALQETAGPSAPWRTTLQAAVARYLEVLARNPAHTHVFIVQSAAASSLVRARRREAHLGFAGILELIAEWARAQDGGSGVPGPWIRFATVEGLVGLVADHLEQGRGRADDDSLGSDLCAYLEAVVVGIALALQ